MAQVHAYPRVSTDETNPLPEKVGRIRTLRLKRGNADAIRRGKEWFEEVHATQKRFTTAVSTLGRDCREWPQGAINTESLTLVEKYSKLGTMVGFNYGSLRRGVVKSEWAYSARQNGMVETGGSCALAQTRSSKMMYQKIRVDY